MKYENKSFKSKNYQINKCKTQDIFEVPQRNLGSESPCLTYKTDMLNECSFYSSEWAMFWVPFLCFFL